MSCKTFRRPRVSLGSLSKTPAILGSIACRALHRARALSRRSPYAPNPRGALRAGSRPVVRGQPKPKRADDLACDVALDCKDVGEIAVVTGRPDMRPRLTVDQL